MSRARHRQPLYSTLHPEPLSINTEAECRIAAEEFLRKGMVVIRLLTREQTEDLIIEQWTNIIDKQPYLPEYKIAHPDPVSERARFLEFALKSNLSAQELQRRKFGWPLHVGFGACCDHASFHSQLIWDIRQHRGASTFARMALGREDIWVDINRSIQKLPGEGEKEMLHWDFNAFDPANTVEGTPPRALSGRVGYNAFSTILAPGSHQPAFFRRFQQEYAQYYPHLSNPGAKNVKVGLDIEKPDPMNLFGDHERGIPSSWAYSVSVDAGCWLVWDERVLHGVVPNERNGPTQYGMYLGYFPAGNKPRYETIADVSEMEDRMDAYVFGKRPKLWPSLDRTSYMPRRFYNFPRIVEARMARMPADDPTIAWRTTPSGRRAPSFEEGDPDPAYTPPELNSNGWRLLCGEPGHGYARPSS